MPPILGMSAISDIGDKVDKLAEIIAKQDEVYQIWLNHLEECEMCASWYERTEYGENPPECPEYWTINAM